MKAMLLRVGIDKGTDGALAPIFADGTFEFIPKSESEREKSTEERTYRDYIGRTGKPFSTYLPKNIWDRQLHFDPEFKTFTYGDPAFIKRNFLLTLEKDDLLVFYTGLTPYGENNNHREGLYIIGYFTVDKVIEFYCLSDKQYEKEIQRYLNNAHSKRINKNKDLVIVVGQDLGKSKLLEEAYPISVKIKKTSKKNKIYTDQVVSKEIEHKLGISGSIRMSIPPRVIINNNCIKNLRSILGL